MFLIKIAIKRLSRYCLKHRCRDCKWYEEPRGCFFGMCVCDWEDMLEEHDD